MGLHQDVNKKLTHCLTYGLISFHTFSGKSQLFCTTKTLNGIFVTSFAHNVLVLLIIVFAIIQLLHLCLSYLGCAHVRSDNERV